MRFIGQFHIMGQLGFILSELYKNPNLSCNFLLSGPSGYGKTTMAVEIATFLVNGKDFEVYWADWTPFKFQKRVIFIDEVHKMKAVEDLYGVMDSKSHVFIFATNIEGNLPEAFTNRCYHYIFTEYTDEELILIAKNSAGFQANDEAFMEIIEAGNRNPRIVKKLCEKISMYFASNPQTSSTTTDFKKLLRNVFDIEDGLDTLCRHYLEILQDVGGNASILLLKNLLHVDENTLKYQIEPILLKKHLIQISSKGRSLSR